MGPGQVDEAFMRLAQNKTAATLRDAILLFLKLYCRSAAVGVKLEGVSVCATQLAQHCCR